MCTCTLLAPLIRRYWLTWFDLGHNMADTAFICLASTKQKIIHVGYMYMYAILCPSETQVGQTPCTLYRWLYLNKHYIHFARLTSNRKVFGSDGHVITRLLRKHAPIIHGVMFVKLTLSSTNGIMVQFPGDFVKILRQIYQRSRHLLLSFHERWYNATTQPDART